ncbi:hypothetical protein Pint_09333 [Pistacia integerrima]|uniref:Uncharacterized protein n=1 Tax=Pistacia integerrima TaxID=434235 RepID=A0ACC0XZN7_9ROSI|nr:hypothetical protein Pint_09333 [Pistacia integerrima]
MAMTADSTANHHSPRGSGFSGDGLSSPQLRRKNLPSPWAQVVRGEPESVSAAVQHSSPSPSPPPPPLTSISESTDNLSSSKVASASSSPPPDNSMAAENLDANNSNAARPKKLAWIKPSNGVVEIGPVMGAVSWPALSESTKPSPKSSVADSSSSKTLSDGSVSNNQVPVIPHLPPKLTSPNANPSSNTNRTMSARQRSRRGGGATSSGGGPAQTAFTRSPQPPPPPPPLPQAFPIAMSPNGVGNLVQAFPDPSPREPLYRGNNWETRSVGGFVSQSHPLNEHRNSSRRGNYGPRGDGTYHNNYGSRRDQDRGNYANARDVHLQQQRGPPRGFVRPPPPTAGTFVPPQPIRPFTNPIAFPDFIYLHPHMEPFRPFMTAPMLMPVAEPPLQTMLVRQIDYYFSDENLARDEFLKSNMDDQGWVTITLIASFPRVSYCSQIIDFLVLLDTHDWCWCAGRFEKLKSCEMKTGGWKTAKLDNKDPLQGRGKCGEMKTGGRKTTKFDNKDPWQGYLQVQAGHPYLTVKNLTNNIQLILDSLRTSAVVEVQEEKVRRRNDWMKYIPPSSRVLTESGLTSPSGSSYGVLTTAFQKITVEGEDNANPHSEDASRRQFSESTGQSKLCNGDGSEVTLSNEN